LDWTAIRMGLEVVWDLSICELFDLQREGDFRNGLAQVRFQLLKRYFMSAVNTIIHHNQLT
jgi:hypothetical protein